MSPHRGPIELWRPGWGKAVYSPSHLGQESVSNLLCHLLPSPNHGPSSSPSAAEPMEADNVVVRGAVSGESRGVRRLGGCEWGAPWAEANPPLPQAPGPPRPGLVPVSIIGAEDEDFENELEAVRSWSGKASVPGVPAPQVPSSVSPPTSGPVLCPQMLPLSALLSLVFVVPSSSSPHPILDPTLFTLTPTLSLLPNYSRDPRPISCNVCPHLLSL